MEDEWADFTVTKIDSARRQFETAITLWFNDGDPVSIRTLAAAAHQVCHGIGKARGIKSNVFFNPSFLPPDKFAAYKKFMLDVENFFKHANKDSDPECTVTFRPRTNDFYLIDGIDLYHGISGNLTLLMKAFRCRFMLLYPTMFPSLKKSLNEGHAIKARQLSGADFLVKFLHEAASAGG